MGWPPPSYISDMLIARRAPFGQDEVFSVMIASFPSAISLRVIAAESRWRVEPGRLAVPALREEQAASPRLPDHQENCSGLPFSKRVRRSAKWNLAKTSASWS